MVDIIGIIVGHFYYFFEDVFPNEPHGFRVLETPRFIKSAFRAIGFDEPPFPEEERPEQFDFANEPAAPARDNTNSMSRNETDEDHRRQSESSGSEGPASNETRQSGTDGILPRRTANEDTGQQLRERIVTENRNS